jgi:hypothetical protein
LPVSFFSALIEKEQPKNIPGNPVICWITLIHCKEGGSWMRRWLMAAMILIFILLGGCAKDTAGLPETGGDSPEQASGMSESGLTSGEKKVEADEQESVAGSSDREGSDSETAEENGDTTETAAQTTDGSNKPDDDPQSKEENKPKSNQDEGTSQGEAAKPAPKDTNKTKKPAEEKQHTAKETPKQPAEKETKETPPPKQETPKEPAKPKQTVNITIAAPDVKGTILSVTAVEWKAGDTVLDITQKIVKARGIQISVRGSGATAYVEGISNLYEFDEGPMSGWEAFVDGTPLDRSAGVYGVNPGETIKWRYTKNYLED